MKLFKNAEKTPDRPIIPGLSTNTDAGSERSFKASVLLFLLLFCTITTWLVKINAVHKPDLQTGIATRIIRFHVIANSDSSKDQALKLQVKDQLVKSLSPLLEDTQSITEARSILKNNLGFIQKTAKSTLHHYGCNSPVTVALEKSFFPLKIYGNYAFPPGIYEALRVKIGSAKGRNWWCVMFPPLCFVDETYSVVDEKTNKKLKHLLTEEEYNSIVRRKKPVKIKFKLWESVKKHMK